MKKKRKLGRKLISYVLALVVVFSTLSGIMPKTSATVFAAEHGEHGGVTFNAWESDNGLPTAAGNYYLTQDVTISSTWNVPGETKLCLNGHSITLNADSGTVVNIGSGATLNLYDCGDSTYYYTLTDGVATGITSEDKSTDGNYESFTGGYITGGKSSGVIIKANGTLNMYGGTIIGNMAEQYGGGVNVKSNGTFNMHSGSILGNKAGESEGAYFDNYGRGGGVCVDGTFNMQGGLIAKNTASRPDSVGSKGGGVYCEDGTFVMSSGKIEQNWATFGGGVYDNSSVTVCGDAEITNNRSETLAGGLYIQKYGELTIGGSVKISDNKNGAFDNNVVDNNVYFDEDADPIVIENGLSDTSSIGVTMENPGVFTYGGSFESKEAAQAVFSSDDSDYEVIADEERNAKLKKAPVKYIRRSWNGSTVTETEESVEDYNVIHDTHSQEDYLTGWYVVKGNVTFGPRIEMSGEVNLILCDGATLTAPMGIEVSEGNTLNIYGQSGDTGTLIATGRDYPYWYTYPTAGIGVGFPNSGNAGIVNIHGGRVIATGATCSEDDNKAGGAGIGGCGNQPYTDREDYNGGTVNIYGGIVTATGGAYAAGIGGGGTSQDYYPSNGANVTIYGGTVTTIGGEGAVGIGGGRCSVDWYSGEDRALILGEGMHLYGNATTEHPENDANNHKEKSGGDYERTRYMTINNVAPHSHSFTYSSEDATITATCDNTDGGHSGDTVSTLTIVAPTLTTYGGTGNAVATIEGSIDGVTNPDIVYKNGDTVLATAPTDAGTYTANITLKDVALTGGETGNVTASVEYTIAPATLTGVSVEQRGTLTYTGEAQTPVVTTSATAVDGQSITFTYSLTEDGTYGDMPTVTNVNDCGTIYYKASAPNHNDVTGSFTVSMNKADKEAPAAPTATSTSVNSITLSSIPNGRYKLGDGEWQTSPTFTGLEMNTSYTFYQKYAEDSNYNESLSSARADISTSNHVHEWSYQADGATITATCANTDGGHSGNTKSTLTIVAPTLTTYGGTGNAAATIEGSIDGVTNPDIVYKNGDTVLAAAPTDAGSYTASVTIDSVTASIEYEIKKADAPVLSDRQKPTKNENIIYDGTEKELITGPVDSITGYTMEYAVTTTDTLPDDLAFDTSIPKETNAGTYYVWYKVIGDKNHRDTEAECIEVKIDKAKGAFPKPANISSWSSDMACVDAVDGQEYVIVAKGGEPDWTKAVTGDEDGTVIFEGLQPYTEYDIYTRVKETENVYAGEAVSTAFLTDLAGFSVEGDTYVGETLTITTDPEDAEGLSYKWYYVNIVEEDEGYRRTELGDAIEGAEGATYTLTEDDYGKYVCVVSYRGDKEYDRSSEYGPVEYDPEKISYRNTEGAGGEWTKGSSDSLQMTFKRSVVDSETFSHFTGIRVDGKAVDASDYTAEAGSVIIKLKPSYLETLTVGEHVLTAQFDDADDAEADFTVKEAETSEDTEDTGEEDETTEDVTTEDTGEDDEISEEADEPAKDADIKPSDTQADTQKTADEKIDSPKTGDETNPQLMLIIMLFAAVDMAVVAFIKSKKKKN